jgi:hypothetical protein
MALSIATPQRSTWATYVERAKQAVTSAVKLPTGYSMIWSGQWENMERVKERMNALSQPPHRAAPTRNLGSEHMRTHSTQPIVIFVAP